MKLAGSSGFEQSGPSEVRGNDTRHVGRQLAVAAFGGKVGQRDRQGFDVSAADVDFHERMGRLKREQKHAQSNGEGP